MKHLILILFLTIVSCSSLKQTEWSSWERCGVAEEKMRWRKCSAVKDDIDLVGKGHCYKARMCRSRKGFLGRKETEYRPKQLFCAYEDQNCNERYGPFGP